MKKKVKKLIVSELYDLDGHMFEMERYEYENCEMELFVEKVNMLGKLFDFDTLKVNGVEVVSGELVFKDDDKRGTIKLGIVSSWG